MSDLPTNHKLDDVLAELERIHCKPRPSGNGYMAFCPVHEADGHGHKPSLSVAKGDTADVVLICRAGCTFNSITQALGLAPKVNGKRHVTATYPYQDASGRTLFEKLRYFPKDFRIRHQDASGAEVWKLPRGVEPPLYRLPAVAAAIASGEPVYYLEGEKDVERLVAAGLCATTNFEGAAAGTQKPKWRDSYAAALAGADVILIPDNDEPGQAHMRHIGAQLAGLAKHVRYLELLELPEKGDVSNWLDAGHTVDELVELVNQAGLREPGSDEAKQKSKVREPGTDDDISLPAHRGTDESNANLFLELHRQKVRFCSSWGKWLLWTGSHWQIDDRMEVDRLAGDVSRNLYAKAAFVLNAAERREMVNLALRLESTRTRTNMLAAVKPHAVIHHSELDCGHFLLNARNGTIDLETGKIRPHRREDWLTHKVGVEYDLKATAPTWLSFLSEVFNRDEELILFIQRAVGYSLTQDVREQVLFLPYGTGSNGKSVFLNILRKLLGKIAVQAAPDLLIADRNRRHPTEQADLYGRRVVICQETGEGHRFNETLVKQLTGGDAIRARRMHEDFWEFEPTHKLWLSTNHRPEIRGTDYAIWRRIRLIPFQVKFHEPGAGDPVKDPAMEARLTAELPGILAWAVLGCLDWQKHGLGIAKAVKDATTSYQEDMDVLAGWLAECCVIGRQYEVKASVLYGEYVEWCNACGEHPLSQRRWGMSLTERGFIREHRRIGHFWLGLGLNG